MPNAQGSLFGSLATMEIEKLESALFNMAIIEAVFGGLTAGKIGSGSYVAGTKTCSCNDSYLSNCIQCNVDYILDIFQKELFIMQRKFIMLIIYEK